MAVKGLSLFHSEEASFAQMEGRSPSHFSDEYPKCWRENSLPTSLNFSEEKVQMEHKFSRTSNSSGRRDQLIVGIHQDRLGFAALTNNPHKNLSALKSVHV